MAKFSSLDKIRTMPAGASGGEAMSKIGRPIGKRSDGAMEPANLILGKQTKFEAKQILERRRIAGGPREDLSMLVERLLRAYISESTGA